MKRRVPFAVWGSIFGGLLLLLLLVVWRLFHGYEIPVSSSISRILPQDQYMVGDAGNGESFRYHSKECTADKDCTLVQDGWCHTIQSVNITSSSWWRAQNKKQTQEAADSQQTCKLTRVEYLQTNHFTAVCTQGQCEARFQDVLQ